MQNMQEWADTVNDEPMPEMISLVPDEARFSLRDSTRELNAGVQVDFVDTIPNEFLEFFK